MSIRTQARAAGHATEPYAATWRVTCLGVVAVWILTLVVYRSTAASMVLKWYESGTFAHGFLIPPIALLFAWRQRHHMFSAAPAPALWAVVLLIGAGLVWLIGALADVNVLQQLGFVALIETALLIVIGPRATWALAFPLTILWFAVPFGEFLTGPLQDFTAVFAVEALRFSGVPVLVEGRALTTPTAHWLVAEACSGVRYVIPAAVLSLIFAKLTYRSWRRRVAFVLFAFTMPVLANGLRAYVIIMLAHHTQNRVAVGIDHLIYGWGFFAAVMLILFMVGSRWREDDIEVQGASSTTDSSEPQHASNRLLVAVVLAALVVASPPVLSVTLFADEAGHVGALIPPPASAPWLPTAGTPLEPHYVGAAATVSQSYSTANSAVHVYVAHYVAERQGEELISSENRLAKPPEWVLIDTRPVQVKIGSEIITVRQDTLRSTRQRTRVAWTWYWVSGEMTLSPVLAKWIRAKNRLFGQPYHAAAIVVSTEQSMEQAAQVTLQDFLDHCPSLSSPVADAA